MTNIVEIERRLEEVLHKKGQLKDLNEFIAVFGWKGAEERELGPHVYLLHTGNSYGLDVYSVDRNVPKGFELQEEWCDCGYRWVWISHFYRSIITYCEGDITISVHDNRESFQAELEMCREFYEGVGNHSPDLSGFDRPGE